MNQEGEEAQDTQDLQCPIAFAGWWIELKPSHRHGGRWVKTRCVDGVVAGGWAGTRGTSSNGVVVRCAAVWKWIERGGVIYP